MNATTLPPHELRLRINAAAMEILSCAGRLNEALVALEPRGRNSAYAAVVRSHALEVERCCDGALLRFDECGATSTRDLALHLVGIRNLACAIREHLEPGTPRLLGPDAGRDELVALIRGLKRTQALHASSTADHESDEQAHQEISDQDAVSVIALRMMAFATQSLPSAYRARYREEWCCELWDLRHSRRTQRRHAFNTLITALQLSRELRSADRSPAPQRWLG